MKKPDPSQSKVRSIVNDISGPFTEEEIKSQKAIGKLLIPEDQVLEFAEPLDIVIRKFLVKNGVTEGYFDRRFKTYEMKTLGRGIQEASNDRSNTVKALKKGQITMRMFMKILSGVLGMKLTKFGIGVIDEDGNEQEVVIEGNEVKSK